MLAHLPAGSVAIPDGGVAGRPRLLSAVCIPEGCAKVAGGGSAPPVSEHPNPASLLLLYPSGVRDLPVACPHAKLMDAEHLPRGLQHQASRRDDLTRGLGKLSPIHRRNL